MKHIILITTILVLVGCANIYQNEQTNPVFKVESFDDCVLAGNDIMESYPRQCIDNGVTYVEIIDEDNTYNEETNLENNNECPKGERSQACTREYIPVCGYFNQNIQCVTYPCANTYSNKCTACADENVAYWEEGECPSSLEKSEIDSDSDNDLNINDNQPVSLSDSCETLGGTWVESAKECEYISQDECEGLGGQFNECASACRNNPEAEFCTMQCVLVCAFK